MAAPMAASNLEFLPNRLMRFFSKYPPLQYSARATGQMIPTIKKRIEMGSKPLSATSVPQQSSIPTLTSTTPESTSTSAAPPTLERDIDNDVDIDVDINTELDAELATSPLLPSSPSTTSFPPNPFLPYKNPSTGRWRGARIGLRQQADLFKMARLHQVEDMLPASVKSSTYRQARALERGLAVKGTGEGQNVKGHKWERQMVANLEKRKRAMEEMPELIRLWEQRGHGRGWKKYPSK